MFKQKNKEKRKGLPSSRYAIIGAGFAVVAFVVLAFLLRGPFIERLTVTPTIVSRLVSPNPAVTDTLTDRITITPRITETLLPVVAVATGTPTPFGIPVTLDTSADLRVGPNEASELVERANAGELIILVGANESYTWFLVGYRSRASWVNAEALGVPIESLRQLPVVAQEGIGVAGPTLTPSPTDSPPTRTALAAITATPVVAQFVADPRVRAGPNDSYAIIAQVAQNSLYQIIGISEDGNWYLARFYDYPVADAVPLQGWIVVGRSQNLISGSLSLVPVISLTQAPLMVTGIQPTRAPTSTPTFTPTPTMTRTATPLPTFTRTRTVTPTAT